MPIIAGGLLVSHCAHWLAVVQVWALAKCLIGGGDAQKRTDSYVPFCSAVLHILSPAGIFLSAPYTESLFAFLHISGLLVYVYAVQYFNHARALSGCLAMVTAGLFFGAATMIRSNGILAGIPYLIEAVTTALAVMSQGFSVTRISRLASVVIGGSLVAVGMITPQVLAYLEYCHGRDLGDRQPWCDLTIPSIFTWTQSHYW
jgi:Gpi18-like mannosyltransferase